MCGWCQLWHKPASRVWGQHLHPGCGLVRDQTVTATYRSGRFSPALPGAGPREGDRRAQPRPATCNGEENVGARVGCVQWGRSAPALLRAGPRWGDRRTLPHPATSLHGWASPPRHLCVHQLGTLVYKVGHTDGVLMQESMD